MFFKSLSLALAAVSLVAGNPVLEKRASVSGIDGANSSTTALE